MSRFQDMAINAGSLMLLALCVAAYAAVAFIAFMLLIALPIFMVIALLKWLGMI